MKLSLCVNFEADLIGVQFPVADRFAHCGLAYVLLF
jgi:hypothetical protein